MQYTKKPMFRYGEADFDREYINWGMTKPEAQKGEAASVMRFFPENQSMRILDLGCGIGTHAIEYANAGHAVTAIDISETFIAKARQSAVEADVNVDFQICDVNAFECDEKFDFVIWIERPFFSIEMAQKIKGFLKPEGIFLTDTRNPWHPKLAKKSACQWKEVDGVFHLESHTADEEGLQLDRWITIDPSNETITEKFQQQHPSDIQSIINGLEEAKFGEVGVRTMMNQYWCGQDTDYWVWIIAKLADPTFEIPD